MPVPKRKTSKSRRDHRSSNNSKLRVSSSIATCPTCQAPVATHAACMQCGYYKGVKVVTTKTDRMHKRGEAMKTRQSTMPAQDVEVAEEKASK